MARVRQRNGKDDEQPVCRLEFDFRDRHYRCTAAVAAAAAVATAIVWPTLRNTFTVYDTL